MPKVIYGTIYIDYQLKYTDRKTLEISVLPEGSVEVVAPKGATIKKINAKVLKRANWIVEQQRFFAQLKPYDSQKEYVNGESHYYLGRRYRLKIEEGTTTLVKLKGCFLWVWTPEKNKPSKIKAALEGWYKKQAFKRFNERLELCYNHMERETLPYPKLSIRKMKKRWGSCVGKHILLNLDLIKAPIYCIDYVIIHELCHLKIPNHSPAFYQLKEKYLPDWVKRKALLEGGI